MGEEGFSGDSSLLYHRESPSALLSVAVVEEHRPALDPLNPAVPLHLRPRDLAEGDDPVLDRRVLLGNEDVQGLRGRGPDHERAAPQRGRR